MAQELDEEEERKNLDSQKEEKIEPIQENAAEYEQKGDKPESQEAAAAEYVAEQSPAGEE